MRPSPYAPLACGLVSIVASLSVASFCLLIGYVELGEVPEPPMVPLCIAVGSLPFTLAVGLLFVGVHRDGDPNRCRECGYDLTGNVSGVCPECGTRIELPQRPPGKPQDR